MEAMRQDAAGSRRPWLEADDAKGFVDEQPTSPLLSVTITPKGRCYTTAKGVIERLAKALGSREEQKPHITLQGIYDDADLAKVSARVASVAARARPFCVNITGLGLLPSTTDPSLLHLHLHVEKSAEIVDLYAQLKANLDAAGLRTYPFSPEEWVPHLTLASGRWSREELLDVLREVGPNLPVCIMPADEIRLNRLHPQQGWQCEARFALGRGITESQVRMGSRPSAFGI